MVRGRITKQASRPLRWALIEAVQRTPAGTPVRQARDAIIARRGIQARNIAKVAAARKCHPPLRMSTGQGSCAVNGVVLM